MFHDFHTFNLKVKLCTVNKCCVCLSCLFACVCVCVLGGDVVNRNWFLEKMATFSGWHVMQAPWLGVGGSCAD